VAQLTGDNTPLPQINEVLPLSGSQVIGAGNTATVFSISLGSLAPSGNGNAYDAKSVAIVIANLGTSVTINAATLSFLDTVDTLSAEIDYTLTSVSCASGATQAFEVALSNGILKNAQLSITFASAPTAGSVGVLANFQSAGSALNSVNVSQINGVTTTMGNGVSGTGVQRVTIASDSTGQIKLATGSNLAGGVNVVDSAGTNKLAVDSSGRLTLVPNQVVELGDGTTPTQKLAIDSSGNASVNIGKYAGVVPVMAGADGNTAANVPLEAQGRFNGATIDQVRTFTKILNFNKVAVTAATPVDSLTPTSGKKFGVICAHLTNDAGKGGIKIQSVSGTTLITVASGSATPDLGQGVPADAINHHLFIDVTDTGNVSGFIGYSEE